MSDKPYTVEPNPNQQYSHRQFTVRGPGVSGLLYDIKEATMVAFQLNLAFEAGQASPSTDRAKLIEALQLSANALDLVQRRRGPFHRDIEAEKALSRLKELGITPTQP